MNLCGLHDRSAGAVAPADTWVLDTVALSENPPPPRYGYGIQWLVRLNWGYGSTGTLPNADGYGEFARRAAAYVAGSSGCTRWIIGNEPNLRREWPNAAPIYPWHYAACFKLCRDAIKAVPGHADDEVLIAASGPWNDECKYEGNPKGDWILYFSDVLELCLGEFDGFSIHSYTHGYDVNLVTDTTRMQSFPNRYYNFLTYRDYCDAVATVYSQLPCYITEANGDGPWQAVGLIPAMLGEVNAWNQGGDLPRISSLIFYRYSADDHYQMSHKDDVMAEYERGVGLGYQSPAATQPRPPTRPTEPPTQLPTPPTDREIDPTLIARGVKFEFVTPAPGTGYWRMVYADHLNEEEADNIGPDHHILGTVIKDGIQAANVPFKVSWPSGSTTVSSKADQLTVDFNYDFPMSSSLNEFSIWVDDGAPSDKVSGIGMGAQGNPSIHTSTWLDWEWVIADVPQPPVQAHAEYVTAPSGANMRAVPVDGAVLLAVPYATEVAVTALQQGSDGYVWKESRYLGYIGWIRADLLALRPPSPGVPIPPAALKLVHPLPGSRITQDFYQGGNAYAAFNLPGHSGTDFGGKPKGTPVCCMAAGVVEDIGFDAHGYGNFVLVKHQELLACTRYAHLDSIGVDVGQLLAAGMPLGGLGSTGNSTGVHLHLGVQLINPDGSFKAGTPMAQGRCDPRTWAIIYGLKL